MRRATGLIGGTMRNLSILLILSSFGASTLSATAEAEDTFAFAEYPVASIYDGKLKLPDFKRRDKDFASFKTRIIGGMKEGVTFAGEYSIVQFGCGTGCTHVVLANNQTGELHGFPRGGEFNQGLTLEYKANSRLMLARWYTDSFWETCVIESFFFSGEDWVAKEALAGTGEAICEGSITAGAEKARGF